MTASRIGRVKARSAVVWGKALACMILALSGAGCQTMQRNDIGDLAPALGTLQTPAARTLFTDPGAHRVQILVSEVIPASGGSRRPGLRRLGYRLGAEYFYPASSIKLCAAVAVLTWLDGAVPEPGRALDAALEIEPLFPGDAAQRQDPGMAGRPEAGRVPITLRREIRKMALVSDNQAFNRIFDVLGHEALNRAMWDLGHSSVVINHRLSETRTLPDPLASAAVRWTGVGLGRGGGTLEVPARVSGLQVENRARGLQIGDAYLRGDERVMGPMDFTRRNGIALVDLQNLLIQVVRPDIDLGGRSLELSAPLRAMLVEAMMQYPRESADPAYDPTAHPDHFTKFLLPGVRRVEASATPGRRIEVTGKIGRAYGFSVENSWLRHPGTGREVFVTAVVYTNADGVLNDDRYEYEALADPFLADLGEWAARRWLVGSGHAAP